MRLRSSRNRWIETAAGISGKLDAAELGKRPRSALAVNSFKEEAGENVCTDSNTQLVAFSYTKKVKPCFFRLLTVVGSHKLPCKELLRSLAQVHAVGEPGLGLTLLWAGLGLCCRDGTQQRLQTLEQCRTGELKGVL